MESFANPYLPRPASPAAAQRARRWLWFAALAVAASSLFAILIVLARVPAVGSLFPGTHFYQVALTLHVNLSQLIWFSAFAGLLWSLAAPERGRRSEAVALASCVAGAAAMAASPALGAITPIMSNYLPVLDDRVFLGGLSLFGVGLGLQAARGLRRSRAGGAVRLGLGLAAAAILLALAMLPWSGLQLGRLAGAAFFEMLFWGSGHVWEFALTTLMMLAWLGLAHHAVARPAPAAAQGFLVAGALPLLVALALQAGFPALSAEYRQGFTDLMRYANWEAPLLLGAVLIFGSRRRSDWRLAVFRLSFGLFVAGLLIGAAIDGQTTVVTAHYHGTIGAVTLAFMGFTFELLPVLGLRAATARQMRRQTACYGWGNLLMMLGLAGAGWMGAPRKMAGNVGLDFSVETAARLLMGLGGTLAMVGIIGFFVLMMRALRLQSQPAHPLGCAAGR